MKAFNNIVNGESGQSVRGKLNNIFADIITGREGINAIWDKLRNIQPSAGSSGITGFIKEASYDPSELDPHSDCTLIALISGTFTHFTDYMGDPIVVSASNSITIFHRSADTDYWDYDTQSLTPALNGDFTLSQDDIESAGMGLIVKNGQAMSPLALFSTIINDDDTTESLYDVIGRISGSLKGIYPYTDIDSLSNPGYYLIRVAASDLSVAFTLVVTLDPTLGRVHQVLFGNVSDPNVSYTVCETQQPSKWCRTGVVSSMSGSVTVGSWGLWDTLDGRMSVTPTVTVGGATKGVAITSKTPSEILRHILCPYVAPEITSKSVSPSLMLYGNTYSSTTISVTAKKGSNGISKITIGGTENSVTESTETVTKTKTLSVTPLDSSVNKINYAISVKDSENNTVSSTVSVTLVGGVFFFFSTENTLPNNMLLNFTTHNVQSARTSPNGSYSLYHSGEEYFYAVIPSSMTINTIKEGGFDVPYALLFSSANMRQGDGVNEVTLGMKVYRSASKFIPGTFNFVINQ